MAKTENDVQSRHSLFLPFYHLSATFARLSRLAGNSMDHCNASQATPVTPLLIHGVQKN